MNKSTLEQANKLYEQLDNLDGFIYGCEQSWKNIIIPKQKRSNNLNIAYKGYGYINRKEFMCDKELSNRIFDVVAQYRDEKKKEFEKMNK